MNVTIPAGLLCSIAKADDKQRCWKGYTTRKAVEGEIIHDDSGAIVVKCGEWLILTRLDRLRDAGKPQQKTMF